MSEENEGEVEETIDPKTQLKSLIRETLDEWKNDQKPAPQKTGDRPKSFIENLLGL